MYTSNTSICTIDDYFNLYLKYTIFNNNYYKCIKRTREYLEYTIYRSSSTTRMPAQKACQLGQPAGPGISKISMYQSIKKTGSWIP